MLFFWEYAVACNTTERTHKTTPKNMRLGNVQYSIDYLLCINTVFVYRRERCAMHTAAHTETQIWKGNVHVIKIPTSTAKWRDTQPISMRQNVLNACGHTIASIIHKSYQMQPKTYTRDREMIQPFPSTAEWVHNSI